MISRHDVAHLPTAHISHLPRTRSSWYEGNKLWVQMDHTAQPAATRTILVIDDDPVLRETMQRQLEMFGFRVVLAADGWEGLAVFARSRPDVVLCDLTMPVMDGLEFARRLRADRQHRQVPLLAVTSRMADTDILDTWRAGFDGHVLKPATGQALADLIQRRIAGRGAAAARVLGDLLPVDETAAPVSEANWMRLVRSIAAGDQQALHLLFNRTHRLVFTLAARITRNRDRAEGITLDVFHQVWRRASQYDAAAGTVIGWIMQQARSRAIDRARFDQRKRRVAPDAMPAGSVTVAANPHDAFDLREPGRRLRDALGLLTPQERQAIEATFFAERTYEDVATQLQQPAGTVKARIRSGLEKLRQALAVKGALSPAVDPHEPEHSALMCLHALQALPSPEVPLADAQLATCATCRHEMEALRPVIDAFVAWPNDVLRPFATLWHRLAQRIGAATDMDPAAQPPIPRVEPAWRDVAPGLTCKVLGIDTETNRVSMLVRLAPGVVYPPHRHDGVEELYLLHGELRVDDTMVHPGDYRRAEPGTGDRRVVSDTGCTCLLITSLHDAIG
jgi:RNA polymerase sigma-70 factor (ECF subfamily)